MHVKELNLSWSFCPIRLKEVAKIINTYQAKTLISLEPSAQSKDIHTKEREKEKSSWGISAQFLQLIALIDFFFFFSSLFFYSPDLESLQE